MKFNYQARNKQGEIQMGAIEAVSKEAAVALLQRHQLFVTVLEPVEAAPFYAKKLAFFDKVSKKEIMIFSRQLSIMFASKVPLVEALQVLAVQSSSSSFREKLAKIIEEVEGGTALSQAMSRYPDIFPSFYINIVKSGEISGTLSRSFTFLADHLERDFQVSQKVKGAMIYPVLLVVTMLSVILLLMIFVVPQLTLILEETGQELPTFTKIVIAIPKILKQWGILMAIALAAAGFLGLRFYKSAEGRKSIEGFLIKIPVLGTLLRQIYLVRFADNFSTLISAGLPIVKSLDVTADVVANDTYKSIILATAEGVRRGEQVSLILAKFPDFIPPLVSQMILVGEKTGAIEPTLKYISDFYQKELDRTLDQLLELIQPILIISLGIVVSGVVAAVLLPMYQAITSGSI